MTALPRAPPRRNASSVVPGGCRPSTGRTSQVRRSPGSLGTSTCTRGTNWEGHAGLPSHQAPPDPHICAMNLQNLFRCHEILQLRWLLNTDSVAFPICVDCSTETQATGVELKTTTGRNPFRRPLPREPHGGSHLGSSSEGLRRSQTLPICQRWTEAIRHDYATA